MFKLLVNITRIHKVNDVCLGFVLFTQIHSNFIIRTLSNLAAPKDVIILFYFHLISYIFLTLSRPGMGRGAFGAHANFEDS